MGALPKRKVSRIRRDRRRAHYLRIKMPTLVPCPQCRTLKVSHHVCRHCGTYSGVQVLPVEDQAASSR